MGYNRVILQGNLTKDPERRVTTSGMAVCEFTVAVNGTRKDDAPYFGAVVVFGNTAEACSRYLGKGSQVLVDGKLKNDEWEDRQTGQKRSKTRIIADSVQFIGERRNSRQNDVSGSNIGITENGQNTHPRFGREDQPPPPPPPNYQPQEPEEDEIPF